MKDRERFYSDLANTVGDYEARLTENEGSGGVGSSVLLDILQNTLGWIALNHEDKLVRDHTASLILRIGGENWQEVAIVSKNEARRYDWGDEGRSDPRLHSGQRSQGRFTCQGGLGPNTSSDLDMSREG